MVGKDPLQLRNDLARFESDLKELGSTTIDLIRMRASCLNFFEKDKSVLHEHKRFLQDAIFELKMAIENSELTEEESLRVHHIERQFQEKVQSLEDRILSLETQLKQVLAAGSSHEKLAERLLIQAKSMTDAEKRIREQWKAELENASENERRDIDRIYHNILQQFREKS